MKRIMVTLALAALFAAIAAPASARGVERHHGARGAAVVIVADVSLPEPFEGPFDARGAAVRRGIVCPSGDLVGTVTGPSTSFYDFTVQHDFTCDDGSGTFSIDLRVRLFDTGRTFFVWTVAGGTDAYAGLTGSGFGIGIPGTPDENIIDRYFGRLRS